MKNMILEMQNSYYPCNIRYCQSIAIGWQGQRAQFLIYTPALDGECEFDRNAKFSQTLTNNKKSPTVRRGETMGQRVFA